MIDSWTKTIRNFSRNSPKPKVEREHGTKTWVDGEVGEDRTRNHQAQRHSRQ